MKSSLHILIPFFPFLLNSSANCQLRNSTQFYSNCLSSLLHTLGAAPATSFIIATEMCLPHSCIATSEVGAHRENRSSIVARIRFRGNVFTELLSSNELFRLSGVLLQYSNCSRAQCARNSALISNGPVA
jgi:hypothetical protein